MPKFNIQVKEILRRVVEIEAETLEEAIDIAKDMYQNEEIVLDADDFAFVGITEETDDY